MAKRMQVIHLNAQKLMGEATMEIRVRIIEGRLYLLRKWMAIKIITFGAWVLGIGETEFVEESDELPG